MKPRVHSQVIRHQISETLWTIISRKLTLFSEFQEFVILRKAWQAEELVKTADLKCEMENNVNQTNEVNEEVIILLLVLFILYSFNLIFRSKSAIQELDYILMQLAVINPCHKTVSKSCFCLSTGAETFPPILSRK